MRKKKPYMESMSMNKSLSQEFDYIITFIVDIH